MGERFRRVGRHLLKVVFQAALPGLIIYSILLLSLILHASTAELLLPLRAHLSLVLTCYVTALICTFLMELRTLCREAFHEDGGLIGNNFSGFRKKDRLFYDAFELFSSKRVRSALELFLEVRDMELTDSERGVCAFYIAQCYQMLSCYSNAIPYYDTALENGFSRHHAMLYQARCCAEGGDFDRSFALFQELLDSDPPKDFFFLYTDIGFLCLRQRLPEQAEEWFQKSISNHQNYAFALSGLAIASLQKGDFTSAKDYQCRAIINRLSDPTSFRKYYEETKRLMLEEHPEWAERQTEQNPT